MGFARSGLLFASLLLVMSLVLIMLGQAGLQAKCKDVCVACGISLARDATGGIEYRVGKYTQPSLSRLNSSRRIKL